MESNLHEIIEENIKRVYGLENEDASYLYKYVYIRASIYYNSKNVKDKKLFDFILNELNISVFLNPIETIIYDEVEYKVIHLAQEIVEMMRFRASMEGDLEYKEIQAEILTKGRKQAYKYNKSKHYQYYIMQKRLRELNSIFGANPTTIEVEGFKHSPGRNPMKRTIEEMNQSIIESPDLIALNEKELENYLVKNLSLIEDGLTIIGQQIPVADGVTDIIAKDKNGTICVIELKVKDDKRIIWQSIHYPLEIKRIYNVEDLRMLVVGPEFSNSIYSALKGTPYVEIFKYTLSSESNKIQDLKIERI